MTNRRMQDSDYLYDADDDRIGLTSAFPPVKGPQSVEYDQGDDAIGLTSAFAPIVEEDDQRSWSEDNKWKNYDWASYQSDALGDDISEASAPDGDDAEEALGTSANEVGQGSSASSAAASGASTAARGSGRGRHAAPDVALSPRMQKAKRTRRVLVVLVILLVIAIGVVAFFAVRTVSNSQKEAAHQAQEQIGNPKEDIGDALSDDAGNAPTKLTDVPDLTPLLGMGSDEAVQKIGHGAIVTANRANNDQDSAIKTNLTVALTDEPVDPKTGSPTVYLGLDADGKVIQVGYSASAAALDFGSLSFTDAVNNEHVIEKTLGKIGVKVPEGSAVLPADKSAYSAYASDGTTVTRERCSFEGDVDVNGAPCTWSAVLSYDYTTQVVTGDLSDTVRIIYVYVTQKV